MLMGGYSRYSMVSKVQAEARRPGKEVYKVKVWETDVEASTTSLHSNIQHTLRTSKRIQDGR